MERPAWGGGWAAVALLVSGCIPSTHLDVQPEVVPPAGGAELASGEDAGVRIRVQRGRWSDGAPTRVEALTPVRVRIVNDSERQLQIRYSDLEIVDADGATYEAVAPFDLKARPTPVPASLRYAFASMVAIRADGFLVAPHHAGFFPQLTPYGFSFAYDPFYHDRHFSPLFLGAAGYPTEPPTAAYAVPEGVVQPGGEVEGFFFFEGLSEDPTGFFLELDLFTPGAEEAFGFVSVRIR